MERVDAHPVAHDMVWVRIAPTWGLGDQHMGAQRADDSHQPTGGLVVIESEPEDFDDELSITALEVEMVDG